MQANPTEADLWTAHVDALKAAIDLRKPDAVQRLKFEIDKLDGEIIAWALRREIRARAGADLSAIELRLKELDARMADLAGVAALIRGTMLETDYGPTPEQAGKARELISGDGECLGQFKNDDPGIDDLSSELKRRATDIHSGWMSITGAARAAISGKPAGSALEGSKTKTLQMQYWGWVQEMHRKRLSTWAIDDVVCEGLSRTASARKRRCSAEKVYDELIAGLDVYTYEPLSKDQDEP